MKRWRWVLAAFGVVCFLVPAKASDKPRKVVLIAGAPDANHPAGTHEYEKSVRLLRRCLETSPNLRGITVEAHFNGWPRDDSTLNDADTIVVISSGSDRREQDHPLLAADRLKTLDRQMRRGCGLVAIHWTTFVPNEPVGERMLDWIGGYFDYQSGPPPRRWASDIRTLTTTAQPADNRHPINRGIAPFLVKEEFYYQIRFQPDDKRRTPILQARIEGKDHVVAWAVQRADGGRGFGFTGGHFFTNWYVDDFRKLVLNAIVWTAGAEVPIGGVLSTPPPAEAFAAAPPAELQAWTPPPKEGASEPWEKFTDADWLDGRFRLTDTGPVLQATVAYPGPTGRTLALKGTAIRVGDRGEATMLFERNQLRWAAGWTGGFLLHSDRRFGLLNTPTPVGTLAFATRIGPGCASPSNSWDSPTPPTAPLPRNWARYRGLYLHGNRAVLSYSVGATSILDAPWAETANGLTVFTRTLEVGPSRQPLQLLICELPANATVEKPVEDIPLLATQDGERWTAVALPPGEKLATLYLAHKNLVDVVLPASDKTRRVKVLIGHGVGKGLDSFLAHCKTTPAARELAPLTRGGPARWPQTITTRGEVASNTAPFVIDTLTVPYDNPYKALMFLSGLDFLPDGTIAVCTAHGDVWLVRGADARLEQLTWKRFATGLYQPLGLKVVQGKIFVTERGQLTRLHDFDGDGEADFYENFNNDWHCAGGEHSYDTCLETDPAGNFYFFKGGDDQTPHGGCLLRVSRDGERLEVFATGFRHPIGLGMSPDGIITGADQEGNWMPATRIDEYRLGGFYGDLRCHHRKVPPTTFDPPICWLPREVDNSAGGQVWVPPSHFGPLAGLPLHLSYGRCKLFVLLRQPLADPNGPPSQGGVVDLGLKFLSGVARGRFHPGDGHLYVTGLTGWQTAAQRDGCLQRVRYTGQPVNVPVGLQVGTDGVRLTFSRPLDRAAAVNAANYQVEQWNYRWSREYGSKRWSVTSPDRTGQDVVLVRAAELLSDERTVRLQLAGLQPVMQMQLSYHLRFADGEPVQGAVWHTIHAVPGTETHPGSSKP